MLWDLNDGKHLYSLEAGDIVNALVFSPNRYWLCAATAGCIKIFDLESKCVSAHRFQSFPMLYRTYYSFHLYASSSSLRSGLPNKLHYRSIVDELKPDFVDVGKNSKEPECVSLAWSTDGQTLFGGFTDNLVRVWTVSA